MKKIKSIWMRLLVIVISVAMMLGCLSGVVFAQSANEGGVRLHENGHIPSKIALGDTFKVPGVIGDVKVSVKGPNGAEVKAESNGDYVAANLGNYTVTYTDESNDMSYTYNINCYEDEEYFIYVDHNGADIPSYIEANKSFPLPNWYLAKEDKDGNLVKLSAENDKVVTVLYIDGEEVKNVPADRMIAISDLGNKRITLAAHFIGKESKEYSKEFTVISQTKVNDTNAPIIRNIANMPSSASVNTKVTLPKAVADDNYDENVLVTVKVTDPDGNEVKDVVVNDQGYAISEKEETVKFDNDRVVSFYPRKEGTYRVIYQAKDDADNWSSELPFKITVTDRTGPVIVDVKDDLIPTVWGLNSVTGMEKDGEANVLTGDELTLNIPIPEVVDNVDDFNLNLADTEKAWKGDIKMTVEVANSNVTVARFPSLTPENLKALANDATKDNYTINATKGDEKYREYYKDGVEGVKLALVDEQLVLRINFNDFYSDETDTANKKTKAGITGNWTITFSFRDKANNGGYNNSQKVYTINISDTAFVDDKAPEIDELTLPDYLVVGNNDETFIVPDIVVSDDKDSRLTEEYYLYVVNPDSESDEIAEADRFYVESGEELNIKTKEVTESESKYIEYYFVREGEEIENGLKVGSDKDGLVTIGFAYSAKDDAGNISYLKTEDDKDYTLNIYTATNGIQNITDVEFFDAEGVEYKAGVSDLLIGGFTVNNISQREFIGFELAVLDEEGNTIDASAHFYYATTDNSESLVVKNITFSPNKGGTYQVNIRIIDAKENSFVYVRKIVVAPKDGQPSVGKNDASVSWSSKGVTRQSYMLQRKPFKVSTPDNTRVFQIKGGAFSILGYAFTPIDQGNYDIYEHYGNKKELADAATDAEFVELLKQNAYYNISVTDDESINVDILGNMPTYFKNKTTGKDNDTTYKYGAFVITNPIVAWSANQNYDVTVKYSHNGTTKTASKAYRTTKADVSETDDEYYSLKEKDGYVFEGEYALVLDQDGEYKIIAVVNGNEYNVITIKVGDIKAPQFTLDIKSATARVNDKFEYVAGFDVSIDEEEKDTEIYIDYRLIEPGSGSTSVSDVSGTISLSDYIKNGKKINISKEYKFTKSGDYTVEYLIRDKAGNKSVQKYTITVSTNTSTTPTSLTMLSTILIIVGVLLIVGVIVYLIRFRKRRA